MYVGLSAEIIPVKESNDKTPANIPAAIIGSRIGVIDSENKSNTAFIGFFLTLFSEEFASPLIPSIEINSLWTSLTWVPTMIW